MKKILLFALISVAIGACATTESTSENAGKTGANIYVFDDVSTNADTSAKQPKDSLVVANTKDSVNVTTDNLNASIKKKMLYYVQVGAFTTEARAKRFVALNSAKISFPMNVSYNDKVKLFVIRLPVFASRQEAERVRNELWKTKEFKDAFIVTEMK